MKLHYCEVHNIMKNSLLRNVLLKNTLLRNHLYDEIHYYGFCCFYDIMKSTIAKIYYHEIHNYEKFIVTKHTITKFIIFTSMYLRNTLLQNKIYYHSQLPNKPIIHK